MLANRVSHGLLRGSIRWIASGRKKLKSANEYVNRADSSGVVSTMMKGMKNPMGLFSRLNLNKRDPVGESSPTTSARNSDQLYSSLAELNQKETLGKLA